MRCVVTIITFCIITITTVFAQSSFDSTLLQHHKTIRGAITPKSIVYAGGRMFAQNMVYRHSTTVYDHNGNLLKTIKDTVTPSKFGYAAYGAQVKGGPVEAVSSSNGKYVWVSNYQMYGKGFENPGCDGCIGNRYDSSFLYRYNTSTFHLDTIVKVGCVPKFVATTCDDHYVLVSNWTSGSITVYNNWLQRIDTTIKVGRYPRGIEFDEFGDTAYVALMGSDAIAKIALQDFSVTKINDIGDAPRHILRGKENFYITLNNEGKLAKWNGRDSIVTQKVYTGKSPRSMAMSPDEAYLYVVNYHSNTLSKIDSKEMKVVQQVKTNPKPIGVAFNPVTNTVWVACYGGSIMLFKEEYERKIEIPNVNQPLIVTKQLEVAPLQKARFAIVVGSFGKVDNANRLKKEYLDKGFKASVIPSNNGYFRVSIASFSTENEALEKLDEYKKMNKAAWVLDTKG